MGQACKRVLQNGRSQVHSNSTLISVGSEVWEGNKAQAAAFELHSI